MQPQYEVLNNFVNQDACLSYKVAVLNYNKPFITVVIIYLDWKFNYVKLKLYYLKSLT